MKEALHRRYKNCSPAKQYLKEDTFKAIWYRTNIAAQVGCKKDQHRLTSLFATLADMLEGIRMRELFPGKERVKSHTFIVGDELSEALHKSMRNGSFSATAPNASMVTEALRNYVIGNSCQNVIVIVGHSDLREGVKPDKIIDACQTIVAYLRRYPHLTIYWLPVPYLHDQRNAWTRLVELMEAMCASHTNHIFLRRHGNRDFIEIFREGRAYCRERISAVGEPTAYGWRVVINFLKEVVILPVPGPKVPSQVCGKRDTDHETADRSEASGPPPTRRQLPGPPAPSRMCGHIGVGPEVAPRSEVSGPRASLSRTKSIAELLEDADKALRAVQEARKAAERSFHQPAAKRFRAQSPDGDDDVIYVGSNEHRRMVE